METLHFSIEINAPVAKVWDTMLGDATYRQWTEVFMPGSYFEGSWEKGPIRFLAKDEDGKPSGMISEIEANRPNEFISIKHLGFIDKGEEITSGKEVEGWVGAHENYTFQDLGDGKTKVVVDVDVTDEYKKDMQDSWPKALEDLKRLCEE